MSALCLTPSLDDSQIEWLDRHHSDPVLKKNFKDKFASEKHNIKKAVRERLEGTYFLQPSRSETLS